jgi:hypothetical protein
MANAIASEGRRSGRESGDVAVELIELAPSERSALDPVGDLSCVLASLPVSRLCPQFSNGVLGIPNKARVALRRFRPGHTSVVRFTFENVDEFLIRYRHPLSLA